MESSKNNSGFTIQYQRMRLSTLLDRSMRLTVTVFVRLFPLYLLSAFLQVGTSLVQDDGQIFNDVRLEMIIVFFVLLAVHLLITFLITLLLPLITASAWSGGQLLTVSEAFKRLSFGLCMRFIWLSIRVIFCSIFFAIFLILPGIIYFVRRILSFYILIIENTSTSYALKKSKDVMRRGRWYRSTSPLFRFSVIATLTLLLSMVTFGIFAVLTISGSIGLTGTVATSGVIFIHTLLSSFIGAFGVVAYCGLYFDALARFEGSDLAQELEANAMPSAH